MRTDGSSRRRGRASPLAGLLALLGLMLPLLFAPACSLAAPRPEAASAVAPCHPGSEMPAPHDPAAPDAPDCCGSCGPTPATGPVAGPVLEAPASVAVPPLSRIPAAPLDLAAVAPCPPARAPPAA